MLMDNIEVGNRVSFFTENQSVTGTVTELRATGVSRAALRGNATCNAHETRQQPGSPAEARVQVDGDRGPPRPVPVTSLHKIR